MLLSVQAHAQVAGETLSGTIRDASGAVDNELDFEVVAQQ
jgi:hypothetical protein